MIIQYEITYMIKNNLHLIAIGALAGFINGFLGTGGGTVILFGSLFISRTQNGDTKKLFASTAAATAVYSVVSLVIYLTKSKFSVDINMLKFFLPALLGGAVGAFLLNRFSARILKLIFGIVATVAGCIMIFK